MINSKLHLKLQLVVGEYLQEWFAEGAAFVFGKHCTIFGQLKTVATHVHPTKL